MTIDEDPNMPEDGRLFGVGTPFGMHLARCRWCNGTQRYKLRAWVCDECDAPGDWLPTDGEIQK